MKDMRSREGRGGFFVHAFSRLNIKDKKDGMGGAETMISILYYLSNQSNMREEKVIVQEWRKAPSEEVFGGKSYSHYQ